MNKYYYDCPIKAVFMAKTFGIKFIHPTIDPIKDGALHSVCTTEPHCYTTIHEVKDIDSSWMDVQWRKDVKFYMHQDGLEIYKNLDKEIQSALAELGILPRNIDYAI